MLVKMSLVEWKVPCSNCKKKKKIPKLKKSGKRNSNRVVDEPSKCCCMVITNISPFLSLFFSFLFFSFLPFSCWTCRELYNDLQQMYLCNLRWWDGNNGIAICDLHSYFENNLCKKTGNFQPSMFNGKYYHNYSYKYLKENKSEEEEKKKTYHRM